jgi:hypothetical protein
MYVEANGYKHPVMVVNNHFTLPIEFKRIFGNSLEKVVLAPIFSEDGFYYFVGSFIREGRDKKESYGLTIDKKIRNILKLKEKDIIEVQVRNNTFYTRVWWRTGKNSMVSFFPGKIFKMLNLKPHIPYQIKIKKSKKSFVSNDHFYSVDKINLEFEKFVRNKRFNLSEFLRSSYARTEGGKLRKFKIRKVGKNKILVNYLSGGPASKEIEIKSTFRLDSNFFRVMGLLQAECSKSLKKTFCFTNETPENIKYVIEWFEKYLNFSRKSWLYELSIDPRIMHEKDSAKEFWSNSLKIPLNLIKVYPKISEHTNKPKKLGTMNLRTHGRTLKEIILRLLESVKNHVVKNRIAAGYFLSGVLAGDGYVVTTKKGSLNYIGICFDPNKVWDDNENELLLYTKCLEKIGILKADLRIYVNRHYKTNQFVKKVSSYGIKINSHKGSSLGFGAALVIFKYRNFIKLLELDPFYPNLSNRAKFISGLNKIDKSRVEG